MKTALKSIPGFHNTICAELYEIYRQKFERLQFRPLYLQLFVESWIANGCATPSMMSTSIYWKSYTLEGKRKLDGTNHDHVEAGRS